MQLCICTQKIYKMPYHFVVTNNRVTCASHVRYDPQISFRCLNLNISMRRLHYQNQKLWQIMRRWHSIRSYKAAKQIAIYLVALYMYSRKSYTIYFDPNNPPNSNLIERQRCYCQSFSSRFSLWRPLERCRIFYRSINRISRW